MANFHGCQVGACHWQMVSSSPCQPCHRLCEHAACRVTPERVTGESEAKVSVVNCIFCPLSPASHIETPTLNVFGDGDRGR